MFYLKTNTQVMVKAGIRDNMKRLGSFLKFIIVYII